MQKQQVKETRQFLGIWIPREIYLNKELNWTDKILVVEINSLDNERGCFASNDYFAEFLSVSTTTISTSISKLKSLGLIEQVSFDGRTRILKAAFKQIKNPPLNKVKGSRKENLKHNKTINKTINKPTIQLRKLKFINDISLLNETKETQNDFVMYWTEETKSKTNPKMKWELEKTFSIEMRLARWKSNDIKWNKNRSGKTSTTNSKTKQNIETWQSARDMLDNLNLPNGN
tara:strand:- start:18402 stop:19094 length:693 start_codon:yes stop_codon:yes gene_type:complete